MRTAKILCTTLYMVLAVIGHAQQDTTHTLLLDTGISDECYGTFFKTCTPVKNKSAITLVINDSTTLSLAAFLSTNNKGLYAQTGTKDVDGDGSKELVVRNFSGGEHCCDELYFFVPVAPDKFKLTASMAAGNSCIGTQNYFSYHLHEMFGSFFTCYACSYEEPARLNGQQKFQPLDVIFVQYKKGKLFVQQGDSKLKKSIVKNLQYLKSLTWDGGAKAGSNDDGRRKEVALNLALYYFSFGKDMPATKKLFTMYYIFPDAATVWAQFTKTLEMVKTNNDF